jgi:hypothetical protein
MCPLVLKLSPSFLTPISRLFAEIDHPAILFGEKGNKYDKTRNKIENRDRQELQNENQGLIEENEKLRQQVDADGYRRDQWLEEQRKLLGVEKKEGRQLTDEDIIEYNSIIREHFYDLDAMVAVDPMKVCVESDPQGNHSFLLQPFLDGLFEKKRNDKVFNKKDFDRCRNALFGDISRDELGQRTTSGIPADIISEWNVVFTKDKCYGNSRKMRGKQCIIFEPKLMCISFIGFIIHKNQLKIQR